MFGERYISILAYNLETILAEKLETIISRGDLNTRPRDFYDVYIIKKLQWKKINTDILKKALIATSTKRETQDKIKQYSHIITVISESTAMQEYWSKYQKNFPYARDISFINICESIRKIFTFIYP